MADEAHLDTDKKIKKLEKEIKTVYTEAQKDIEEKMADFSQKYMIKDQIYAQQVKEGKITKEWYQNWQKGQVFQGEQWKAKRDEIIDTIHNSNTIATKIINGTAYGVFMTNANYTAYDLEHTNGINFGFGIYDSKTVSRLLKDNPDLLPKWKVNEQKDYVWNKKKVTNAITQGIIQGESLDKITKRLTTGLVASNENTMKTFARTAMTGAQNAGREQRLMSAKAKGLNVVKEWMATLDGRTRDTHRMMDGEKLPVAKDIWHPAKFSNGCRYPGDPEAPASEVYNCRCTMVGDLLDFPEEYERYDNVDGKPIKNMTYKEWYKAKYGKEIKIKKIVKKSAAKLAGIDYSKYPGGKDTFDVIKKYGGDYDKFINNSTLEEFDAVYQHVDYIQNAKPWFDSAIDDIKKAEALEKKTKVGKAVAKTKELTEIEKLEMQVKAAEDDLKAFENSLGADKDIFSKKWVGIWQNDVTLADYEIKKDAIMDKKLYYLNANAQLEKSFISNELNLPVQEHVGLLKQFGKYDSLEDLKNDKHMVDYLLNATLKDGDKLIYDVSDIDDLWVMVKDSYEYKKIAKNLKYIDDLNEFEKLGAKYAPKLKEYEEKKMQVKTANNALRLATKGDPFDPKNYTAERKNAAVWARTSKEADNVLRSSTGEVWKNATKEEREAIYDYTISYSKFNEPLRGWEYGVSNYNTGAGFKGIGSTDLNAGSLKNGSKLNAMTDILDKSSLPEDQWFQRGCGYKGMDKFLNCDIDLLRNGTQEELENALLGTTPTEYGFLSCGSSKGQGFSGDVIFNVYAPQGTKAMYVEPFSCYGHGAKSANWDGISGQSNFGSELETIFQQGTQFRITKIERSGGTVYIDMDVIDQSKQQRWKP